MHITGSRSLLCRKKENVLASAFHDGGPASINHPSGSIDIVKPPDAVVSGAASAHYGRPNAHKPRSPARAPNAILSKCHMSPIDLRLQFDHGAQVAVQKNNRRQGWIVDRFVLRLSQHRSKSVLPGPVPIETGLADPALVRSQDPRHHSADRRDADIVAR